MAAAAAAALEIVDLAVSPIISKLVNKACSYLGGDVTAQNLRDLQTTILPKIQVVIEAAEITRIDQLKLWLWELKAATYEAEDLMDEYEYKLLEYQVSGLSPSLLPLAKSFRKIGSKAKEFLAPITPKTKLMKSLDRLKNIAARVDGFVNLLKLPNIGISSGAARPDETANQRPSASSSSVIYGRDEERDSVINLLVSVGDEPESSTSNWKVPIFAICGIGGAGKTALAQYIFNDKRIVDHFNMRMWVQVSREFDVSTVTRKMIESSTEDECPHFENLDTLQKKLKKKLESNKKFLLVLDDVWCDKWKNTEQWEQLVNPLNEIADNGSRILITTRTARAASVLGIKDPISLKELESKDCWSIIKHYAFGDSETAVDRELVEVGEQIVKELKGSPLAAKMVGRQLGSNVNVDAWRFILNGDMLEDTMDILLWSYKRLPAHLQRCFAFCSLFPKGYLFECSDLVHLWMAEGFIELLDENKLSTEDMGNQYFHVLLSYSFFQYHPTYSNYYVIHDLLHDLAERVSKDDCFRIEGVHKPVEIPATVLHLSITTDNLAMHIPNIGKMGNLRTMIVFYGYQIKYNYALNDMMEMFKKLRRLRVLSWIHFPMEELPSSIGCLKHLRYLNLSWSGMKKLPKSLCKLYHLQLLNINSYKLDSAPECLNNLISLKHLQAVRATPPLGGNLISMIPEIGKLTSLQTLREYHVQKKQGYEIGQLKNLSNLRGELHILNLENVKDKMEAAGAMLKDKKHLNRLILQWASSERDDRPDNELEVLEGLEPHPHLKELHIIAYRGVRFANWMLDNRCLCELIIKDCPVLMEVPPLYHSIRKLVIDKCPKLMELPSLPHSLREFQISNCLKLLELPSLPHSLNKLQISDCPELMEVSPFPDNLEELYIRACPGIETLMSELSYAEEVVGTVLLPSPLRKLTIEDCSVSQIIISRCLQKFTSLSYLEVNNCPSITTLFLDHLTTLVTLDVGGCQNLTSFGGLEALLSLRNLQVSRCPKLATGGGGAGCPSSVNCLTIDELSLLAVLLQEEGLNSLQRLEITDCPQDIAFTPQQEEMFQHLTSLSDLKFWNCQNLPSLPVNLEKLSSLKCLVIFTCFKIESLPNQPTSLEQLMIMGCHPQLKVQYRKGGPLRHKIDHIPDVVIF